MNKFTKKYQLWEYSGESGYSYNEFDTLQEALEAHRYTTDCYITQRVDYEVIEKDKE